MYKISINTVEYHFEPSPFGGLDEYFTPGERIERNYDNFNDLRCDIVFVCSHLVHYHDYLIKTKINNRQEKDITVRYLRDYLDWFDDNFNAEKSVVIDIDIVFNKKRYYLSKS
jgi:hypothetical protein